MNNSLSLNLANQAASAEQFWITLEQENTDSLAAVSEAAEVIDELFSLDPCISIEEVDTSESQQSLEESLEDARLIFNDTLLENQETLCMDENGCFLATLRVYRSHQNRSYTLLIQGGEKVSTVVGNVNLVTKTITIKDASFVSIDLPADQPISVSWQGPCHSTNKGRLEQSPEIIVSGGRISWGISISAVLSVQYSIPYDLVSIQTTEEDCIITALFHLSVDEIDLEPPSQDDAASTLCNEIAQMVAGDDDPSGECYAEVWHDVRCSCTNESAGESYPTREGTGCPDGVNPGTVVSRTSDVTYKYCGTIDDVNDPAYYEKKCCAPPLWILPTCKKTYGVYNGGASADIEQVAALRKTYGNRISFIPVGPKSGPCGTSETEQVVHALNCCDDVEQITWDVENSVDVIADFSYGTVAVLGGKSPYYWRVAGQGFYTNAACTKRTATTNLPRLTIFTKNSCGTCSVYVTDTCSSMSGFVRSANGVWEQRTPIFENEATTCLVNAAGGGVQCWFSDQVCMGIGDICKSSTPWEIVKGKYKVRMNNGQCIGTYYVNCGNHYGVEQISGIRYQISKDCKPLNETLWRSCTFDPQLLFEWVC